MNAKALAAEPDYAALVRQQCSIVVSENALKWDALRPARGTFDFEAADALLAFAEADRIKVRGHTLVWHRQLPGWFAAEASAGNARTMLGEHIDRVAGRYGGRMHSWDVVNEAVHLADGRPDGLRDSPWLRLIGEDYIEFAFLSARAADPQALLAYNDFGLESESADAQAKRLAVLLLLRRLKARHVPVDAVGIQAHLAAAAGERYGAGLRRFLADLRELDLQVFLTEMDVNDRSLAADAPARDAAVAAAYMSFLDVALSDPNVRVLMTWGLTNRHTWLNGENARVDHLPERALPFDEKLSPTEAFFAVRNSLDRRRHS